MYAIRSYYGGQDDPGAVVIDEVAGQWLTLLPAATTVWWHWLAGFALFRFFDIVKPWPVGWADRRVKGGLGVMVDDIIAGAYAGVLLYALIRLGEATHRITSYNVCYTKLLRVASRVTWKTRPVSGSMR